MRSFKVLDWLRETRDQISEELEELSDEEQLSYFEEKSGLFQKQYDKNLLKKTGGKRGKDI
ncbi:MAG TPA: hypothetical protein ENI73_07970 [Spirochaetes bacterium]|nr:hypothetical protein [Spirochaetota bacterium]